MVAALFVFSATAVGGGSTRQYGAPEDTWLGVSNEDDVARTLTVKCPENTSADSIEAVPDDEGVVFVVQCNNTN